MKKTKLLIAFCFLLALSFNAKAQAPANDYFLGKWSVVVEGTPQGDSKMTVVLERKDGKLNGYMPPLKDAADSVKFSKIEEKENSVRLYFTAQGYNVNLTLTKKDDDHVTGSMMDMFDAKGERVKANVVK